MGFLNFERGCLRKLKLALNYYVVEDDLEPITFLLLLPNSRAGVIDVCCDAGG